MEESEYLKIKADYEKCIKDMNTDLKKNIDMLGNRDYYKKIFQYTMSFNNIDDFDINEVPDVGLKERSIFNSLLDSRKKNLKYIHDRIGKKFYIIDSSNSSIKNDTIYYYNVYDEESNRYIPQYIQLHNTLDKYINTLKNILLNDNHKNTNNIFNIKENIDILKKTVTNLNKVESIQKNTIDLYKSINTRFIINITILGILSFFIVCMLFLI